MIRSAAGNDNISSDVLKAVGVPIARAPRDNKIAVSSCLVPPLESYFFFFLEQLKNSIKSAISSMQLIHFIILCIIHIYMPIFHRRERKSGRFSSKICVTHM